MSMRARADHHDEKANAEGTMIENEHVQTNGRKANRVDSEYRPDWIRIGSHRLRVTQQSSQMDYPVMSPFTNTQKFQEQLIDRSLTASISQRLEWMNHSEHAHV